MLTATKKALWKATKKYMDENGHTFYTMRKNNPFKGIFCQRSILSLKKAAEQDVNIPFNREKCAKLFDFLGVPYQLDGGVLSMQRELKLILLGEPIAKQSVRQGKSRNGETVFYQPSSYDELEMRYRIQVLKQRPKDFKIFTEWVRLEKAIFVHPPLKSHLKNKKTLEFLQNGGLIRKTTKPDLKDNLYKFPLDVLTGLVYKDDSLICEGGEDGKYFGLNPRIEFYFIGE